MKNFYKLFAIVAGLLLSASYSISTSADVQESTTISTRQTMVVKGKVVDAKYGEPIIGASVAVQGTSEGTITDVVGNFTLEVTPNDILIISYAGYSTKEVVCNRSNLGTIRLSEN